jgi:PadR family transcriptional regulator PadR
MPRRPSPQTTAVIDALARDPGTWRHGYDLLKDLDMKAGTLYPILMRLCDRGALEARWEDDPPPGRPPRHLYRLDGGLAPAPRPQPQPQPQPGTVPAW